MKRLVVLVFLLTGCQASRPHINIDMEVEEIQDTYWPEEYHVERKQIRQMENDHT